MKEEQKNCIKGKIQEIKWKSEKKNVAWKKTHTQNSKCKQDSYRFHKTEAESKSSDETMFIALTLCRFFQLVIDDSSHVWINAIEVAVCVIQFEWSHFNRNHIEWIVYGIQWKIDWSPEIVRNCIQQVVN